MLPRVIRSLSVGKCLRINFNGIHTTASRSFLDLTENTVCTPSGHVERHVTNLIVRRPFTRFYNLTTFDSCGGRRLSYGWLCGEVTIKVIRLGSASVESTKVLVVSSSFEILYTARSYYRYFEEESNGRSIIQSL